MTYQVPFSGSGAGSTNVGNIFTMTAQPFDSSLGTLQSFTVSWVVTGTAYSTVDPATPSGSGHVGLYAYGDLRIGSFGYPLSSSASDILGNSNGGGTAGVYTSDDYDFAPFSVTFQASTVYPLVRDLVTGTESFPIKWNASYNYGYSYIASGNSTIQAVGTMTYTYTPVPEPSAMLMGAAGALAFLRRRR